MPSNRQPVQCFIEYLMHINDFRRQPLDLTIRENIRKFLQNPQSQVFLRLVSNKIVDILNRQSQPHFKLDSQTRDASQKNLLIHSFICLLIEDLCSREQEIFQMALNGQTQEATLQMLEQLFILNWQNNNRMQDFQLLQRFMCQTSIMQDLSQKKINFQLHFCDNPDIFKVQIHKSQIDSQRIIVSLQSNLQITLKKLAALKQLTNTLSNSKIMKIMLIVPEESEQQNKYRDILNTFLSQMEVSNLQKIPIRTRKQDELQQFFDKQDEYTIGCSLSKRTENAIQYPSQALQNINSPKSTIKTRFLNISWRRLEQLRQLFPSNEYLLRIEQKLISDYLQSLLKNNKQLLCRIVQACHQYLCKREEKYLAEILHDILPKSLCETIISRIDIWLGQIYRSAANQMQIISDDNGYICRIIQITKKIDLTNLLQHMLQNSVSMQNYINIIQLIKQVSLKVWQLLMQLNKKECLSYFNNLYSQSTEQGIPFAPRQIIQDPNLSDLKLLQSQPRVQETKYTIQTLSINHVCGQNHEYCENNKHQSTKSISNYIDHQPFPLMVFLELKDFMQKQRYKFNQNDSEFKLSLSNQENEIKDGPNQQQPQ